MKIKTRIIDKILDIFEGYPKKGWLFVHILDGSLSGRLFDVFLHIVDFFSSAVSYLRREKKEFEE